MSHFETITEDMLREFIKRSWRPYLAAMISFSVMLAGLFTVTSGGARLGDALFLVPSILIVAVPVTLVVAMPVAYWAWRVQQRSFSGISVIQSTWIGFVAGALLHTMFLMFFGGWMALPQILVFTIVCGGGYGATFAFLFSRWGGLKQADGAQGGAGEPPDRADGQQ